MTKNSPSTQAGDLNAETTATPQGLPSSNAGNPSTSATSATTADPKSPKDSQRTPNLQDAPNAARLIMALGAKLGKLVEWRKVTLGDGQEVYALCFPVSKWAVDPVSKELLPR